MACGEPYNPLMEGRDHVFSRAMDREFVRMAEEVARREQAAWAKWLIEDGRDQMHGPGDVVTYPEPPEAPTRATTLPDDPKERKEFPIATGFLDYFPDAVVAVSHVSFVGNQQHNPGQPLHWARGKSMDQDDTMLRHFMARGTKDTDGQRHSAKAAWRMMAILQLEIEAEQRLATPKPSCARVNRHQAKEAK